MNVSALTLRSKRSQRVVGDAHLRFQLTGDVYAVLAMQQVQEVLVLPAHRLTSMPNMPACVLGLMNRRSHVFWVVDLAQLLGIPGPSTNRQQYNIIIIRVGQVSLAVTVHQVDGMSWLSSNEIQPPPSHLTSDMATYLRGYVVQNQQVFLVISAESIVQSAVLHHHSPN
ncbi:MAG: purine-binding chemotaxis protein CheW [Leptolyngbyaceae cyanobacterium RU_5_1]|nr:purine-binding chemotaxis protein CheW [Leptolyngbyaceae cyanobacterium RU_5_1]